MILLKETIPSYHIQSLTKPCQLDNNSISLCIKCAITNKKLPFVRNSGSGIITWFNPRHCVNRLSLQRINAPLITNTLYQKGTNLLWVKTQNMSLLKIVIDSLLLRGEDLNEIFRTVKRFLLTCYGEYLSWLIKIKQHQLINIRNRKDALNMRLCFIKDVS